MTAPKTREAPRPQALYARILRLKHINPSGLLCFLFFEGSVALAVVLAFAELVNWLAVAVLPLSIAVMVKVNDATEAIDAAQRARQSAAYRYE